jgi:hypothetical protein
MTARPARRQEGIPRKGLYIVIVSLFCPPTFVRANTASNDNDTFQFFLIYQLVRKIWSSAVWHIMCTFGSLVLVYWRCAMKMTKMLITVVVGIALMISAGVASAAVARQTDAVRSQAKSQTKAVQKDTVQNSAAAVRAVEPSPQWKAYLKAMPKTAMKVKKSDVLSSRRVILRDAGGGIVSPVGSFFGRVDGVVANAHGRATAVFGAIFIPEKGQWVKGSFVVDLPGQAVDAPKDYTLIFRTAPGKPVNMCGYDSDGHLSVGTEGCSNAQPKTDSHDMVWQGTFEEATEKTFWIAEKTGQGVKSDQSADPADIDTDTIGGGGAEDAWGDDDGPLGSDDDSAGDGSGGDNDYGYDLSEDEDDDDEMPNPIDDGRGGGTRGIDPAMQYFISGEMIVSIVSDASGRSTVSFFPEGGSGGRGPGVNPYENVSPMSKGSSVSMGGGAGDPGRGVGGVGPNPVTSDNASLQGGVGSPGHGTVSPGGGVGPNPTAGSRVTVVPLSDLPDF